MNNPTLNRIKSFDTITTKLLVLVLFTTLIPLIVVSNLSVGIIFEQKEHVQETLIKDSLTVQKDEAIRQRAKNHLEALLYIAIASLFVAIIFAILFSRKITTPILKLSNAAISLAKGDLYSRVDVRGKDEIARLGKTFNEMAINLQTQQRLRDNFIAALTHDLKVPMLAENQTIDYILKGAYGEVTDQQKEVLELIKSTNNSSLEMVCTLLDVYKYDMGQFNLIKSDFDVVELINTVINEVKSLGIQKGIDISIKTNANSIIINADKKEIKRVIYNIISNAINNSYNKSVVECNIEIAQSKEYYAPENKTHESTTLEKEINIKDSVIISINDSGVGISQNDINNLFKKFSLNKGRNPSGSGIGLYFSYQVVKNHKGYIWAESTQGQGSSFKISIPLKTKEA